MGLYDVQLDEPRPQFGQERQKKNRLILLFYMSRVYSKTGATSPASLFHPFTERIQSRREDGMSMCFLLQPLPRPCIHACAHPHAIIGTAAACLTLDAQLTSFPTLPSLFAGSICCWRRRLGGGKSSFDIQLVADHIQLVGIDDRQVRS